MGSDFVDDFLDMMPDTLVATPGAVDGYGDWLASGEVLSLPCRCEGRVRTLRDAGGTIVISTAQAIVGGAYGLTVDVHRYTLPVRFSPRTDLRAQFVEKVSDEDGPCYEIVYFP